MTHEEHELIACFAEGLDSIRDQIRARKTYDPNDGMAILALADAIDRLHDILRRVEVGEQ